MQKVTYCKIPKASSKTSKKIFSGLIFCAIYNRTFEFSNLKIEKRISQQVRADYSYKSRLLHELRDTNLSCLTKDKKDVKKFALQFALKLIKINIFLMRKRGDVHSTSWKSILKTNKR